MPLSITRTEGESVRIGQTLVTVKRLTSGKVVLSIDAPTNVPIVRSEIDAYPLPKADGYVSRKT